METTIQFKVKGYYTPRHLHLLTCILEQGEDYDLSEAASLIHTLIDMTELRSREVLDELKEMEGETASYKLFKSIAHSF